MATPGKYQPTSDDTVDLVQVEGADTTAAETPAEEPAIVIPCNKVDPYHGHGGNYRIDERGNRVPV